MEDNNSKKNIIWITPDHFFDVDWPIVGLLKKRYNIRWYVIWGKGSLRTPPKNSNIYKLVKLPYRYRDLRIIKLYYYLIKEMMNFSPNMIYNGFNGIPFFYPLLFLMFDRRKVMHEGHEIDPYISVQHDSLTVAYVKYYLRRVGHVHVFSKHAQNKFYKLYPKQHCTYIPMVPKDYGKAKQLIEHKNKTVFLFFGSIRYTKRFDILLQAFLSLDDEHLQKSELWVYGNCEGTERKKYNQMIAGYQNIKAIFDFVPDNLVPNLFNSADYLVLPYQQITQSGPMMIAYNYNLPVIASDIDGFKEHINDGNNGYLFEVNNANDLKRVLTACIDQNKDEYFHIKENARFYVEREYSPKVIIEKYQTMLDKFIAKNED